MTTFHLDQSPRSRLAGKARTELPSDRKYIDAPSVTRDEALELMIHHLQLAAAYFEPVPDDPAATRAELTRIMQLQLPVGLRDTDYQTPPLVAGLAWLSAIEEYYLELKLKYPD